MRVLLLLPVAVVCSVLLPVGDEAHHQQHWCLAPPRPLQPPTTATIYTSQHTYLPNTYFITNFKMHYISLQYIHYIVCESPIYCAKGSKLLKRRLSMQSRVSAD